MHSFLDCRAIDTFNTPDDNNTTSNDTEAHTHQLSDIVVDDAFFDGFSSIYNGILRTCNDRGSTNVFTVEYDNKDDKICTVLDELYKQKHVSDNEFFDIIVHWWMSRTIPDDDV